MSSTTVAMNRELALHTIIDAYKKGCDITTLELIAGGVLDKFAEYQWSLPAEGDTSGDESSINTGPKKSKKPRKPPTPLDLEAFRSKFSEDPEAIKKSELVKAVGKNGFNLGHLCPDAPAPAEGKKKGGNKIFCTTSEKLRAILSNHFSTEPEAETGGDSSDDEDAPKVEDIPIAPTGKHTRFKDDDE